MEQLVAEASATEIRQMAERHEVCYEVWPAWALVDDRRLQVGFELDVCGKAAQPGDAPRVELYGELKQIATSVLPLDPGDAKFDLLPFDNSFHESPRRGFRPEIVLALQILHRNGFDQPVDDSEERCLHEIEGALNRLGIKRAY